MTLEVTHRIPAPLHLAAAKENGSRYAGMNVVAALVRQSKPILYAATDGRMLAIVQGEKPAKHEAGAPDRIDLIPAAASAHAWKPGKGAMRTVTLNGRATAHHPKGDLTADAVEGHFPPVLDVVPNPGQHKYAALAIDAASLHKLAQSMGSEGGVTLFIRLGDDGHIDPRKPISVKPDGDGVESPSLGVIMPRALDAETLENPTEAYAKHYAAIIGA